MLCKYVYTSNLYKYIFNTKKIILAISFFVFSLFNPIKLNAEIIQDSIYKFSLDIPEGFVLSDTSEDGMTYLFTHPNIPVEFSLKIEKTSETKSPYVLEKTLSKLSAAFSIDDFSWNNTDCAISDFAFKLDKNYSGWAVCAPSQIKNTFITLLCYAPSNKRQACDQFIMSTINSLCTNDEYFCMPGIILTYAFPKEGEKSIKLNINGNSIQSKIDNSDIDAANFLVELEYSVLKLYSKHNLWQEAWERYYRMIYRDSFGRLENCVSDVFDVLIPLSKKKNPSNPDLFVAQQILSWTQTFSYQRNNASANNSDFTSLPAAICGYGSDCDSRSLLVCLFMRCLGYESIMLISPEYSHALACIELNAPGQKYIPAGTDREFLMGETTAKVTWGMIAQNQADRTKWIPIILP